MRTFNYDDRPGFYVFRRKQRLDRNWGTRMEGDDNNQKLCPSSDIEKQRKSLLLRHTHTLNAEKHVHTYSYRYLYIKC